MQVIIYTTDPKAERNYLAAAQKIYPDDQTTVVRSCTELEIVLNRDPRKIRTISYAGAWMSVSDARKHIELERNVQG